MGMWHKATQEVGRKTVQISCNLKTQEATPNDEGNYAGRMPALRNANGAKEVSYI
jgi:hypothetical protein